MSSRKWLGKALVYAVLELGALCGVPMRPDEIERLLKMNERSAVTCVKRSEDSEDPKTDDDVSSADSSDVKN